MFRKADLNLASFIPPRILTGTDNLVCAPTTSQPQEPTARSKAPPSFRCLKWRRQSCLGSHDLAATTIRRSISPSVAQTLLSVLLRPRSNNRYPHDRAKCLQSRGTDLKLPLFVAAPNLPANSSKSATKYTCLPRLHSRTKSRSGSLAATCPEMSPTTASRYL
jgi:hypothetical protein